MSVCQRTLKSDFLKHSSIDPIYHVEMFFQFQSHFGSKDKLIVDLAINLNLG